MQNLPGANVLTHLDLVKLYYVLDLNQVGWWHQTINGIDCVGYVTCSAPSHYLNQCWVIVNWTIRKNFRWNLNQNYNIFIKENAFKMSSAIWLPFCPQEDEWASPGHVTSVVALLHQSACPAGMKHVLHYIILLFLFIDTFHGILTHCGIVTPYDDINMGKHWLGSLLTDGTKPLPKPMLTYHRWCSDVANMLKN